MNNNRLVKNGTGSIHKQNYRYPFCNYCSKTSTAASPKPIFYKSHRKHQMGVYPKNVKDFL